MSEEQILKRFEIEKLCWEIHKELKEENDFFPATNDIQLMEPILKVIPGLIGGPKGTVEDSYDGVEVQAILGTPDFLYKRSMTLTGKCAYESESRRPELKKLISEFKRDMTIWPKK